ncbi:hypothetical protein B5V89_00590 [Heyndrickxia sporothermodurans]|nr:hypothetical protein B5V89_00590 [Heyndrickxia sporothermodurans]
MLKKILVKFKKHSFVQKLYLIVFKLVSLIPKNKKLIMFESFLGKQYSCNPRAIYEYLLKENVDYQMYWSIDPRYIHNFQEQNIKYIKRFSIKWLFLMAHAGYWVTNSRMPLWIPKPRNTVYLQTWHGTPLKRLAADMEEVHMAGTTTEKYKKDFHKESANWDFLISPNEYSTNIFKRAFNFHNTVIESGYPRNDYLYTNNNPEKTMKLKEKIGIPFDKKVLLYAPTWRDDQFNQNGHYEFNLELDIELLREQLGDQYVILLRTHYLIAANLDLSIYNGFAYNVSQYNDIRDLYLISDLLITDYSSVFFDFANLKRPMIFYVYDIENYRDHLRGFYFDFEKKAPGPLVKTSEEVIETIKDMEREDFEMPSSFAEFYSRFCYLEKGISTKRVVHQVFQYKEK